MGPALGNMNAPCSTEAFNGRQPLEIGERSGSDGVPSQLVLNIAPNIAVGTHARFSISNLAQPKTRRCSLEAARPLQAPRF
jgi:hypothetical protein